MTKEKVSKIGFLRDNPNATYEEYFKATGGSRQNYHSNKWILKKGRKAKKPVPKTMTVKVKAHRRNPANREISAELLEAHIQIKNLTAENQNLKHQIIGFRAVVSYLEDMAGIRNSQ